MLRNAAPFVQVLNGRQKDVSFGLLVETRAGLNPLYTRSYPLPAKSVVKYLPQIMVPVLAALLVAPIKNVRRGSGVLRQLLARNRKVLEEVAGSVKQRLRTVVRQRQVG